MSEANVELVRRIYDVWSREESARELRFCWFQSHREALEAAGLSELA